MLQRITNVLQVTGRRYDNVSGTSCKLRDQDVKMYQEHLASYLTNMLERIRNVLQVTWRRVYNISVTSGKLLQEEFSGTSCMLLEEVVPTYQERLASYLKKMLQRIRNIWQVIWRRVYKYQERLASHTQKMLQRIRNIWQVTWKRCCNVSATFWETRDQCAISNIVSVCCRVQHKPFSGDLREVPKEAVSVCICLAILQVYMYIYIYLSTYLSIYIYIYIYFFCVEYLYWIIVKALET